MDITLQQVEAGVEAALSFAQKLAPLAALGGPAAGAIGDTVSQVAGALGTVIKAVENDAAIIGSGDMTRIRALQAQLQAENTSLASRIDAS